MYIHLRSTQTTECVQEIKDSLLLEFSVHRNVFLTIKNKQLPGQAVGIKIQKKNTIFRCTVPVVSTSPDVGWSPGQLCACKNRELIDESV